MHIEIIITKLYHKEYRIRIKFATQHNTTLLGKYDETT